MCTIKILPVNQFCLIRRDNDIWACLFYITSRMLNHFTRVLTIITDIAKSNLSYLPAVIFTYFSNRSIKLIL